MYDWQVYKPNKELLKKIYEWIQKNGTTKNYSFAERTDINTAKYIYVAKARILPFPTSSKIFEFSTELYSGYRTPTDEHTAELKEVLYQIGFQEHDNQFSPSFFKGLLK